MATAAFKWQVGICTLSTQQSTTTPHRRTPSRHNGVVRLRGEGATIVWPEQEMIEITDVVRKLLRIKGGDFTPQRQGQEYSEAREYLWQKLLQKPRQAGVMALATANGWDAADQAYRPLLLLRRAHRPSAGRHLPWCFHAGLLEFPYWLRLGGDDAGVVVHTAVPLDLRALPAELVVDQLPHNWPVPETMQAYLLRPAPDRHRDRLRPAHQGS